VTAKTVLIEDLEEVLFAYEEMARRE